MGKKRLVPIAVAGALAATMALSFAQPAAGAQAEPAVSSLAWYWEEAQREEIPNPAGGTTIVETPNPFCPGPGQGLGAPSQSCAEGRLPIEIHGGDYETPNKVSAVAFDFSLIPIGSEVHKFTVRFREAKAGCYEKDGKADQDPNDDQCEQTDPANVGDHQLQACFVDDFFGDGEARPYREAPKYTCSKSDPKAKRKELKLKAGPGSNFYWTFDLTAFAKRWIKSLSGTTGIIITGAPAGENPGPNDNWRVVLTGPKFENGITPLLDFTAAEQPVLELPPTDPGTGTTTTTTGTGSFGTGSTGTLGGGDTGTGSIGTGGAPTETGEAPSEVPALATEGAETSAQGIPGYVWFAILAGIIGFSLFRSVVLESAAGIRPNGVLATIHKINSDRKGGAIAGETGASNSVIEGIKTVTANAKAGLGKLAFWKKG